MCHLLAVNCSLDNEETAKAFAKLLFILQFETQLEFYFTPSGEFSKLGFPVCGF